MAASNRDVKNYIVIEDFDERISKGPPRIELSIHMHVFYRMIVSSLNLDLDEGTGRFLEGMKLYIFLGAMYESWVNDFLRKYLRGHRDAPVEMFKAVERQQLAEKLKVIENKIVGDWWAEGIQLIRKVSEMRNRLIHFKDPPTIVDAASMSVAFDSRTGTYAEWFYALREAAPNPRIYDDLVDQDLQMVREKCIQLYEKLNSIAQPSPPQI